MWSPSNNSKMAIAGLVLGIASMRLYVTSAFAPVLSPLTSVTRRRTADINTQLYSSTSSTLPEGIIKTITKPGNGPPLRLGDVATVRYDCYIPSSSSSSLSATFAKSNKQKVVVGDGIMIKGWELALATMSVGETATVRIEDASQFGYGSDGVPPIVPPNAIIEMEMEVLDSEEQPKIGTAAAASVGSASGIIGGATGSGELGALDPSKPRTPETIAAAYKARQDQAAIDQLNEKEGLEGLIEKAKNFYFFGFFEGETGQQAPWFLRPSITFPIAFAIVGAAFYVLFYFGGISERGAQVKDELDDIILSSISLRDALVIAFASIPIELDI